MMLTGILTTITLLLLAAYAYRIALYARAFPPPAMTERNGKSFPLVSVIIPARNEADHITACLKALLAQRYPADKLEIILVDDQSEDATAAIAQQFPVKLVRSQPPPGTVAFKKQAITAGIAQASGEIILTTDADCIVPPNWVGIMTDALETQQAYMITGPVRMVPGSSFLGIFQSLDFSILQGITAAAVSTGMHDMSSGANLAYRKQFFLAVNGFQGVDDIASGDDMLLMQKFSERYPGKIGYAFSKEAIVDTKTESSWRLFLRQRIRWASKARRYRDPLLFRILLLVYLFNCALFILMLHSMTSWYALAACLVCLLLKVLVEWRFVSGVLRFFSLSRLLPWFPLAQPAHIIYTVVSGLFGQAGSYPWKGRNVK